VNWCCTLISTVCFITKTACGTAKRGAYLSAPERYSLFQHANLLEQLLVPYPQVQIVLSTSWVRRYGMTTTAKRLPSSLQARVIGATFHSRHMNNDEFMDMPRGQQVHEDVLRRRPRDWPDEHAARFVQTHMHDGLSDPAVKSAFERKLKEMCK
jgi:hypothetical protein